MIDIPDGISSDQELGRIMLGISNALSMETGVVAGGLPA